MHKPLFIGSGGLLGIQLAATAPTDGVPILEIGKLLVQVAIGVATIWKMFKKDKPQDPPKLN